MRVLRTTIVRGFVFVCCDCLGMCCAAVGLVCQVAAAVVWHFCSA